MIAVFFSDVHILKNDSERTSLFHAFSRDVLSAADYIFILGDLFEFYHGYDNYIYPWYQSIADTLRELSGQGKTIYFIEGNHEFGMGSFFEQYTGSICVEREISMPLDGKKIYMAHGDSSDRFCFGKLLKSSLVYHIMDIIGPGPTWMGAKWASFFLSRKTKPYSVEIKDIFRSFGQKKLGQGYDAVILAHSHIADKVTGTENQHTQIYMNTGDFGVAFSFVSYESSSGFELKTYNWNRVNEKTN